MTKWTGIGMCCALFGCAGSVQGGGEDPPAGELARAADAAGAGDAAGTGIRGMAIDWETAAPLGGVTVCGDADHVTHCTETGADGRFSLPSLPGFDGADLVFLADGRPPARARVPLFGGSAWYYATLPSEPLIARFNAGAPGSPLEPGGILIRAVTEGALAAGAEHIDASSETDDAPLDVLYATEDGVADPALVSMSASGMAGVPLSSPAAVRFSLPEGGACRFRDGLVTERIVVAESDALNLVRVVCAEALRTP